MNKTILKTALLTTALALPMSANAVLLGRDINGGAVLGSDSSAVFLYDDVLNVTWLRNADANGVMNWSTANAWAANLVVGVYGGWRLPTMIDTGDSGCDYAYSGTDCGFNVQTKSGNKTQYEEGQTVYSEMASLYYDTLGNKAPRDTFGGFPSDYGLANKGDFLSMRSYGYWSGLAYAPSTAVYAWGFGTFSGGQYNGGQADFLNALAVRSGDVLAPIPEPETYALMLAGLAVVGAAARRRSTAQITDLR